MNYETLISTFKSALTEAFLKRQRLRSQKAKVDKNSDGKFKITCLFLGIVIVSPVHLSASRAASHWDCACAGWLRDIFFLAQKFQCGGAPPFFLKKSACTGFPPNASLAFAPSLSGLFVGLFLQLQG